MSAMAVEEMELNTTAVVPNDDEDYSQVALLIEHLKADNMNLRVSAMRSLPVIAEALGPHRVKAELIPFINDSTDDDDEVLLCMAEQIGKLTANVGGKQHAYELLIPLEQLVAVEENTVREKALDSVQTVARCLSPEQLTSQLVPLLSRLTMKEWFTARMSACCLAAPTYALLPGGVKAGADARAHVRELYKKLCTDDTPMSPHFCPSSRVAAHNLGPLCKEVETEFIERDMLELFTVLSEDDQDSVRLQTVDNCTALASVLPAEGQTLHVLPVVMDSTKDKSWRVRWSVANKYHELCSSLGREVTNGPMCTGYEALLQDSEPEVRTAAAMNATKVVELMDVDIVLGKIFPCLQQLVMDPSDHVRQALASVMNDMSPVLGRDHTINHLLPMLLSLLRDNNADVRLNIISGLQAVNGVVGVQLLSASLLPAIVDLAEDKKWRVRLAIIEHTPVLAIQLGAQFFNDKLCSTCLTWLGDNVFSIRVAATDNLKRLTDHFGTQWAREHILPKVMEMHVHSSYLHRMTALYAIQVLTESLDVDMLGKEVLPLVLQMASDPVPNIRFNVSKTLEKMAPRLQNAAVENQVRPTLHSLVDDADRDVRYFSRKAMQTVAAMG
ncbi:unnamed protein product [Ascophyllum nodosum]